MMFPFRSRTSKKLANRLVSGFLFYFALFFAVVILRYFLLPEGFLLSKNRLVDVEFSGDFWPHFMRLSGYNLAGAALIFLFNCFVDHSGDKNRVPVGYFMLGALFALSTVTLGTWSFTVRSAPPDLEGRLLRQFDLARRSGFREMSGLLPVTCASCDVSARRRARQADTSVRLLAKGEIAALCIGILLMLCGAWIETRAIFYGM